MQFCIHLKNSCKFQIHKHKNNILIIPPTYMYRTLNMKSF